MKAKYLCFILVLAITLSASSVFAQFVNNTNSSGGGGDTTPPVISSAYPSGTLPFSEATMTNGIVVSVVTNEPATCRYSLNPNTNYDLMAPFTYTYSTSHSFLSGVVTGLAYNFYVKCSDNSGNKNTNDYTISFSMAYPPEYTGSCADTDGGHDYYVKGRTTGASACVNQSQCTATTTLDFCSGNSLAEYYCQNNFAYVENFNCPYGCSNGACITYSNTTNTTAQPYIKVVSPNGGETWFIGLLYTISWSSNRPTSDIVSIQLLKSGVPVFRWDSSYSSPSFSWTIQPISAFGTLQPGNDYQIRINMDTTRNIIGDDIISDDSDSYFTIAAQPNTNTTATCTDSDGGKNYYVYGYTEGKDENGNTGKFYDVCNSQPGYANYVNEGPYVSENYCDNLISKKYDYLCPNGCSNGACLKETVNQIYVKSRSDLKALVNQAFHATFTAYGGKPPYAWNIVEGNLPPGLSLQQPPQIAAPCYMDEAGNSVCPPPPSEILLVGTPTQIGTFKFRLSAKDSLGNIGGETFVLYVVGEEQRKTYVSISTDKTKYAQNEKVTIKAYASGSDISDLQMSAVIHKPDGSTDRLLLVPTNKIYGDDTNVVTAKVTGYTTIAEPVSAETVKYYPTNVLEFSGVYVNANVFGDYKITVDSNKEIEQNPAHFTVFNSDILEKYLILHDIGDYKFVTADARQDVLQDFKVSMYAAQYLLGNTNGAVAMVLDLNDRNEAERLLNWMKNEGSKNRYGMEESTIEGNNVLVFRSGSESIAAWSHGNFIIVVQGQQRYYQAQTQAGYASAGAASQVETAAVSPATGKVTETSSSCPTFYTCPDGGKVSYCSIQTITDANGQVTSGGCLCPSISPSTLCSVPSVTACPAVCVPMWKKTPVQCVTAPCYPVCEYTDCGSGCGPDNVNTFPTEETCKNSTYEQVTESVKCVFNGSNTTQKCYVAGSDSSPSCYGTEACVVDITGTRGEKITWKSSCGGYAYTIMDGTNEYAEFKCSSTPVCSEPPPNTVLCRQGTHQQKVLNDRGCVTGYKCVEDERPYCDGGSTNSDCYCKDNEKKEETDRGCTEGECHTYYTCVPKETSSDLPRPVVIAYLEKYPSDLGKPHEEKKDVSNEELLEIAFRLENLWKRFDELQKNSIVLANYYRSINDTANAGKFDKVADLFEQAKDKVDEIKNKIRNNINNPDTIIDEIRSDIKELRSFLREILLTVLGVGEGTSTGEAASGSAGATSSLNSILGAG